MKGIAKTISPSARFSTDKLSALEQILEREGKRLESPPRLHALHSRDTAPLSFAQQRLWFLDLMRHGDHTYNMPTAIRLRGTFNFEAFVYGLNRVVQRHAALRTYFGATENGEPRQFIRPYSKINLEIIEVTGKNQVEREEQVGVLAIEEARRAFNLSAGPPIRTRIFRISEFDYVILLTVHHIVFDEWSRAILLKEICNCYSAFAEGGEFDVEDLPIQYADYAVWQREWMRGEVLERQLNYWRTQLDGCNNILNLPIDYVRPAVDNHDGTRHQFKLAGGLGRDLKLLAREESATLFMLLLASVSILLWKYTGQCDFNIGVALADRTLQETEELIGLFVNTLVMRTPVNEYESFDKLLSRVKETAIAAYAHQDFPFERLVQELQPERDLAHSTLFQVMFGLQAPVHRTVQLDNLELALMDNERSGAKYDLSFFIEDDGNELGGVLEYNTGLFKAETIGRLIEHWNQLLLAIVAGPTVPLWELRMLSAEEYHQIIYGWHQAVEADPASGSIISLFEAQVGRTPSAVAASYLEQRLTFEELDAISNQLASYLRKRQVGPEVLVGICLQRTVEMLIAMLGVLKAGGAYLPLDPNFPLERLRYMIDDADTQLVITTESFRSVLPSSLGEIICLDHEWHRLIVEPRTRLGVVTGGRNLAYVIYTSGSTGQPKGVMITNQGLANYLRWSTREYEVAEGKGAPVHTSMSFDLGVTSIYCPLLAGRPVFFAPDDAGPDGLREILTAHDEFSFVKLTPAHIEMLDMHFSIETTKAPKCLVVGGEALRFEVLKDWRLRAPGTRLVNEYGPTETVVGCCTYEVRPEDPFFGPVPIGRPIAGTKIYVLDTKLRPVPIGVHGEIYIGGAGVARGYLKQPDLTAEKFLPDPFSDEMGARFYKSGDLGKYRSDGVIEYLGRIDDQIKLRGFRIEPAEIESVLTKVPGVKQVAVALHELNPTDKRLIAYVVFGDGANETLDAADLMKYLEERLPNYMVPSLVIRLKDLPLTANGKLDRSSLPLTQENIPSTTLLPRDELELKLIVAWEHLLNVAPIGRRDSFFSLGGHSFLAVSLLQMIKEEFGQELPLSALFEEPTVEHLADLLRHHQRSERTSNIVQIQFSGKKPPIFFVHAVSGGALCYLPLARLIPDRPFFGLQSIDIEDREQSSDFSIEERASVYIESVRKVQARGPYLLGGWSFGGYVAYEMARQLRQQEQEVSLLALLDIPAQINVEQPMQRDDAELLLSIGNDAIQYEHPSLMLSFSEIDRVPQNERIAHILEVLTKAKVLPPHITLQQVRNYLRSYRSRDAALRRYRLAPYDGAITLIRTAERTATEQDLGWSALSPFPVEVHFVPGNHHNMIYPPHVEGLAGILRSCLSSSSPST